MRTDPNLYSGVNAAIQQSEQTLQTAMSQLSSGKRVALPGDDPLAFAQNLQSLATSTQVDRYSANADAVLSQAQMADSALSGVVTSLTQAISLGTEGGNSTVTTAQRATLAQQVQAILQDVVGQANATSNGVPLFAGSASVAAAFVPDPGQPNGYLYQGNGESNQVTVGDAITVSVNQPGDAVFASADGNVLGSLQQMIAALQSGSPTDIASANTAVTQATAHIGEVRAVYGSTVGQLNAQNSFLSQETVSLSAQQASLTDVDTATAATNLSQAQTAYSAVLAMAAKVLPQSLLNYLH